MAVTAQSLAGKSASQARGDANDGADAAASQSGRDVKLDNYDQAR